MNTAFVRLMASIENVVAIMITLAVFAYYIATFWLDYVIDLNLSIRNVTLPPELYAFALFGLWAGFQRAKANLPVIGGKFEKFWRWEDKLEAGLMTTFLLVTLVYAIARTDNVTFIVPLVVYLGYALYDWYDNVKRRVGLAVLGTGSELPERIEQPVRVVGVFQYFRRLPGGEEVPWDPGPLIEGKIVDRT